MPLNEYGEKLDSNGYAPSILHDKPVCLICGRYGTARHEVYFGSAYRAKKKLQGLCDEHNFTFRFFKDRYPITLVITPINDVATQMDMLGNVEETGYCSQDSSMCWYFENSELKTKVKGTFSIDKVLRTKIENILLKMISFWQQYFFRDLMENGKLRNFGVPVPDVPDSNSQRDSQQDTKQDAKQDAPQDDTNDDDEPPEDSAEDDTEE